MGGPPAESGPKFPLANGDTSRGSVMAFRGIADPKTQLPSLDPAWISGGFDHPEPVVIANGVIYALSNGENAVQEGGEKTRFENTHPAVLRALDASTGKELYNSGTSMTYGFTSAV